MWNRLPRSSPLILEEAGEDWEIGVAKSGPIWHRRGSYQLESGAAFCTSDLSRRAGWADLAALVGSCTLVKSNLAVILTSRLCVRDGFTRAANCSRYSDESQETIKFLVVDSSCTRDTILSR